jgi:tRNA(Met) cytidine acetyltransferase
VISPTRPSADETARLAVSLLRAARISRQRRALVLAGRRDWGTAAAATSLRAADIRDCLWMTDAAVEGFETTPPGQAKRWLGRELEALVLDAHAGFDPDAFGAVSGAVRGGGLVILLTPPVADWPALPDPEHARIAVFPQRPDELTGRFIRRLAAVITSSPDLTLLEQGRPLPPPAAGTAGPPDPAGPREDGPWRTEDQRLAVLAVERVARGHRRRPLVLTSDRGRGKSAAFGIAAARIMADGPARILVTGPRVEAVRPVLRHAAALLPGADADRMRVSSGRAVLEYRAPDALARERPEADLLLVDEAAAVPVPLLERLLARYARVAFASTVHGYEGSGRGFTLRFHRTLDRETPGWRALRLQAPVRWARDDPVERLVFRALLLDADAPPPGVIGPPGDWRVERVDRDALAVDEAGLSETFGLLVLAHYRTRPFDLRQLLDAPNVSLYTLRDAGRLLGTALVAREGSLPTVLAREIRGGRRRVRGHLIPQSLEAHLGLTGAAGLSGDRIMRIAVHPDVQGRGIGTRLVEALVTRAREDGCDWVGASFGGTPGLIGFWRRSGLVPVRVGFTREAVSGSHSVMVMQGLSQAGRAVVAAGRERLLSGTPHLLSGPLRELDPALAAALLRAGPGGGAGESASGEPDARDWADLAGFAFARRPYEDSHPAIWRLACLALADPDGPLAGRPRDATLLIQAVLIKQGWVDTARSQGLAGRGAVIDALRQVCGRLLEAYRPGSTP